MILLFHIYRNNSKEKWKKYLILYSIFNLPMLILDFKGNWYEVGGYLFPIIISKLYNGQNGSKKCIHKWFFYVFYPIHLIILGVLFYT